MPDTEVLTSSSPQLQPTPQEVVALKPSPLAGAGILAANEELEGGEVSDRVQPTTGPVREGPTKTPDEYRATLAYILVGLLSLTIVGHYVGVVVLEVLGQKTDGISSAFNASLPVVSGLVASAVTYYFTKEQLKK